MDIKDLYKPNALETASKLRKNLDFMKNPNMIECYNENLKFGFWIEEAKDGMWSEKGTCDKNVIKVYKVYDSEKNYCDYYPIYKDDTAVSLSAYKWILETANTIKSFCDFAVREPFEILNNNKRRAKGSELINRFGQWAIVLC